MVKERGWGNERERGGGRKKGQSVKECERENLAPDVNDGARARCADRPVPRDHLHKCDKVVSLALYVGSSVVSLARSRSLPHSLSRLA